MTHRSHFGSRRLWLKPRRLASDVTHAMPLAYAAVQREIRRWIAGVTTEDMTVALRKIAVWVWMAQQYVWRLLVLAMHLASGRRKATLRLLQELCVIAHGVLACKESMIIWPYDHNEEIIPQVVRKSWKAQTSSDMVQGERREVLNCRSGSDSRPWSTGGLPWSTGGRPWSTGVKGCLGLHNQYFLEPK